MAELINELTQIDEAADANKRRAKTYSKCDYIMLVGPCQKNCIEGRTRCGQHFKKPQQQLNVMCKNGCGRATKSETQICVKCGQNRAHQKRYHIARMQEKNANISSQEPVVEVNL